MYLNPLDSVHHLLIGSFLKYILTFSTLLVAMATFPVPIMGSNLLIAI